MEVFFKLTEFLIEPTDDIDLVIADKIYNYHIIPMIPIRKKLGFAIYPSMRSGYRSLAYEISRGRGGGSQHTFKDLGAVDWTCEDFETNKGKLLKELIDDTEYTRIAVYKTFIHADYKDTGGERQLFHSGSDSKWIFTKFI